MSRKLFVLGFWFFFFGGELEEKKSFKSHAVDTNYFHSQFDFFVDKALSKKRMQFNWKIEKRREKFTFVLFESEGTFDNDELALVSLLWGWWRMALWIALYRCKSLSLETYGKYCLTALPLGPKSTQQEKKIKWK